MHRRLGQSQGAAKVLRRSQSAVAVVATAVAIVVTAGCASTAPKPSYSREIVPESLLGMLDHADVKIDTAQDVKILQHEQERLTQEVSSKIELRRVNNVGGASAHNYEIDLHLTRYDKGNAFARAMLAGLG